MKSVPELLRIRADEQPDEIAYTFTDRHGRREITYAGLWEGASTAARVVGGLTEPGDRCIISMPTSLDYLTTFFGITLAGRVAVPLPETGIANAQAHQRLEHVVTDCRPRLVVTSDDSSVAELSTNPAVIDSGAAVLPGLTGGRAPHAGTIEADADSLLMLQYTSGSIGNPKGVQVTHGNVLHNSSEVGSRFDLSRSSVGVNWLPLFHDMGLLGGIMVPLRLGFPMHLLPTSAMLRHPLNWLEAISEHRATVSGGPNFAYRQCVERIGAADLDSLDLSCWSVAFSGAERVSATTMERFSQHFRRAGFRSEAMLACYGLAENTVFVSSSSPGAGLTTTRFDSGRLESEGQLVTAAADDTGKRTTRLVSNGTSDEGINVRVLDTDGVPLPDGSVGEVTVVAGPSASKGYWNGAPLSVDGLLRTGDLGAVHNGELYITGRRKELLIFAGRNVYPTDVESLVQTLDPSFEKGYGAAFAVRDTNRDIERLVVVQAVRGGAARRSEEAAKRVGREVSQHFGVGVADVVLVARKAIPRTTSGKVRRTEAKHMYERGEFRTKPRPDTKAGADLQRRIKQFLGERGDWLLADERRTIAPPILLGLGNMGVLGLEAPTSVGGAGACSSQALEAVAAVGEIDLSLATFVGIHNALGLRPVLRHGTKELRERWVGPLASGRALAGFALSEPGAGSNPAAMQMFARREGGVWRLHGQKSWVGNAAWAELLTVVCRTVENGVTTGFATFAVPLDRPGVSHGPEVLTLGVRSVVQSEIRFDGVELDDSHLLGGPDQGMEIANDVVAFGRLGIAAMALGGMRRALWYAMQYGSRRQIATGRLLDNGATQERLTEWLNAHDGTKALVDSLAARLDSGERLAHEETAAVKIVAAERLWMVVDGVMQLLGARGYAENSGLPQLLRDGRLFRIFEGPTEVLEGYLGTRSIRRFSAESTVPELRSAVRLARERVSDADSPVREATLNRLGRAIAEEQAYEAAAAGADDSVTQWSREQLQRACRAVAAVDLASTAATEQRLQCLLEDVPARAGFPDAERGLDPWLRPSETKHPSALPAEPTATVSPPAALSVESGEARASDEQAIVSKILDETARLSNQAREVLDAHMPFSDFGLDSVDATELMYELNAATGLELDVVAVYDNPTPVALASHIAVQQQMGLSADYESTGLLEELKHELRG